MHYGEFSFCKSLTGHLRLLASSSVAVRSLLAYPETCEPFLEKLFFLSPVFTSKWRLFNDLGARESQSSFCLCGNYEKKAGDIVFFFLIALPSSRGLQKKLYQKKKNENCERLFLWNRDFSLFKIH